MKPGPDGSWERNGITYGKGWWPDGGERGWGHVDDWPADHHVHTPDCWQTEPVMMSMPGVGKTLVVQCAVLLDKAHPQWSLYVASDVGYKADA